jgi:hypothetical protein
MESPEPIENPYASPLCVEVQEDADSLLYSATRLYRITGWCGIAYVLIAYFAAVTPELFEGQLDVGFALGGAMIHSLSIGFFAIIISTANHLAADPRRYRRRARWLGILAATIFFPVLTIPAALAVRRLARCRRFVTRGTHE